MSAGEEVGTVSKLFYRLADWLLGGQLERLAVAIRGDNIDD